jgi:hypothetical protein
VSYALYALRQIVFTSRRARAAEPVAPLDRTD